MRKRHAKKKPAKRKQSTALAKRPKLALHLGTQKKTLLPQIFEKSRDLTDAISLGELGLVELKLTAEEELVLAEPVPSREIQLKPTKHPTPYLPHPVYTKWFNRAFGRLGWAIVPAAKPMKSENAIVCPYILYIHGRPVAFAMGEQDYFENNKDQSYGDALESTVASALRRLAKRMGVGLELWDRHFLDEFIGQHGVCVTTEGRDGKQGKAWRRRDAAPLWNEVRRGSQRPQERADVREGEVSTPPAERRQERPPVASAAPSEPISEPQRKRLWAIIKTSGRSEEEVRGWFKRRFGWTSSKQVMKGDYEFVCRSIESPGTLPEA